MSQRPTVPLVQLPEEALQELEQFGASRASSSSKLYRALANQPSLLLAWINMAWRLRRDCSLPSRIRELMILRAAQILKSDYALSGHRRQALAIGVTPDELDAVDGWEASPLFTESDRAAMALLEEMVSGAVTENTSDRVAEFFNPAQRIELIVTSGMYSMVPRVLSALALDPD